MESSALYDCPEPPLGSHLVSPRIGYYHHGLYCGQGHVIHFSGMAHFPHLRQLKMVPRLLRMSRVELVTLHQFCANYGYKVVAHPHARYSPEEAVARARGRLGERGYATLSNNCEHFVNWSLEGKPQSWIIWRMLLILGFALGGLRLLNCIRISEPPSRNTRRLVRSGLVSLVGALAMSALTVLSLRSARGLEPMEIRYRQWGRRGVGVGFVLGLAMSGLGLRRKIRSWTLLGPFVLPPVLGLLGYLLPLRSSPVAKKKLK